MFDLENDVMLSNCPEEIYEIQGENDENEVDSRSNRQGQKMVHNDEEFRSHSNTNLSENSGLTVETSRAINSEISSQVSRKLEELKPDLKALILEVINSAISEKVLPMIENAITPTKTALNTKWDFRSDGLHLNNTGQMFQFCDLYAVGLTDSIRARLRTQKSDLRSGGLHSSKIGPMA